MPSLKPIPLLACLLMGLAASAQISPTHMTVSNPGAQGFPDVLTGSQLDYGQMIHSGDGLIAHTVTAVEIYQVLLPNIKFPDGPDRKVRLTRRVTLVSNAFHWFAPMGIFPTRAITLDQALGAGVTQAQIAALGIPDPYLQDEGLIALSFEESSIASDNGTGSGYSWISAGDRRQGTLNLAVDIPPTSTFMWRLGVTSALGEERYTGLVLAPGPQLLQITHVEAGNGLVSLTALNSDNTATTFHRELPIVVRKDTPGLASMKFATDPQDPKRFRLYSLAVGQNSQNEKGTLPLTANRTAMVRVMAYDAMGAGPDSAGNPFNLEVDVFNASRQQVWSTTFQNPIGTRLAKTGRIGLQGPGPVIPPQYVQAGLRVQVNLINPATNQVVDNLSIEPTVIQPRKIVIHGFDVRPYHGDSGCPVARTPSQMNAWILPYTQEVFPYADISYQYDGKVWLMDYGQFPSRGIITNAAALFVMNVLQGMHQTDTRAPVEHLYVAFLNQKYGSASYPGMAWYGYRGAALTRIDGDPHPGPYDEGLGYNLAHEMGHCFGLEHAPSAGANSYFLALHFNRIDQNYHYGGGGLAGGWGYSALGNYFLSEDSGTFANGRQAHWDPMSYSYYGLRNYTEQRFSDLYTQRLLPGSARPQLPLMGGTGPSPVTLATRPDGIQVFDATSAAQAQAWFQGLTSPATPSIRPTAPAPDGTDPLAGVNPLLGDPDDPTPPVLIVTQTPIIPGLTVSQ